MTFELAPIEGLPEVLSIRPLKRGDDRGWFMEVYKQSEFAAHGIRGRFVQLNHSRSKQKHTLRGIHYQLEPKAQGKLVQCTAGKVFDVAVDLRKDSPTFRRWVGVTLSAEDRRLVWMPPGFGHGLCTLTEETEVAYLVTEEFDPSLDRAIRWDDGEIGIRWPARTPILSRRDAEAPLVKDAELNFFVGRP